MGSGKFYWLILISSIPALCKTDKVVNKAAEVANKQIEQELRKDRIAGKRMIKVLLLG
jgi:hypothetical protein